jgi:hypothetical protein
MTYSWAQALTSKMLSGKEYVDFNSGRMSEEYFPLHVVNEAGEKKQPRSLSKGDATHDGRPGG